MSEILKDTRETAKEIKSEQSDISLENDCDIDSASEVNEKDKRIIKIRYVKYLVDVNISARIIPIYKLTDIINSCNKISHSVFTMYLKGYDINEIASAHNISLNNVYKLIRTNRKRCLKK